MMKGYIYGIHVQEYMESMEEEDPEKYRTHFKSYIDAGIGPDDVEDMYSDVSTHPCLGCTLLRARAGQGPCGQHALEAQDARNSVHSARDCCSWGRGQLMGQRPWVHGAKPGYWGIPCEAVGEVRGAAGGDQGCTRVGMQ